MRSDRECETLGNMGRFGIRSFAFLFVAALYLWLVVGEVQAAGFSNMSSTMPVSRTKHTATLLQKGTVLVAGGVFQNFSTATNTSYLFNTNTGKFTPTATTIPVSVFKHTATMLQNGKVLIAGGRDRNGFVSNKLIIYDPSLDTYTDLSPVVMQQRYGHTATRLNDGRVLIAGGYDITGNVLGTAQIFNPFTNSLDPPPTAMTSLRTDHTATLITKGPAAGKVLLAGGVTTVACNVIIDTAELYDPGTNTFIATSNMFSTRSNHTATLLGNDPNGRILLAGGNVDTACSVPNVTNTAEIYDPSTGLFSQTQSPPGTPANMTVAGANHTATLLPDGTVLLYGGALVNIYDPVTGNFSFLTPLFNLATTRFNPTATLLPNGTVMIIGGDNAGVPVTTKGGYYIPGSISFVTLAPGLESSPTVTAPRQNHASTVLPDGRILITGGSDATSTPQALSFIFDPQTQTYTTFLLSGAREKHTATLLPSGKVLIAGGFTAPGPAAPTNSAELFDPQTGISTLMPAGSAMNRPRAGHSATLLPDGRVLFAGGAGPNNDATVTSGDDTLEIFDPSQTTGQFKLVETAPLTPLLLPQGIFNQTATLLPDGKVLIVGGEFFNGSSSATSRAYLFNPVPPFTIASLTELFAPDGIGPGQDRSRHTATLLPNGKVLIAGGFNAATSVGNSFIFDYQTQTFSAIPGNLPPLSTNSGRYEHTATLMPSGKVLLTGGINTDAGLQATVVLYDPEWNSFTLPGNMNSARTRHTATLLPDGGLFLVGGFGGATAINTVEIVPEGVLVPPNRRPSISVMTPIPGPLASVFAGGIQFNGDSEGSGGGSNSSAVNYPLLRLRHADSGMTFYPGSDQTTIWTDALLNSAPLPADMPQGHYMASIIANGIPSIYSPWRHVPFMQVTPGAALLTFPPTPLNVASASQTVTITNNGTATLVLKSSVLTGIDSPMFTVTGPAFPIVIPSGQFANFTVTFTPASNGTKNCDMVIASNDPDIPSRLITFTGTGGVAAPLSIIASPPPPGVAGISYPPYTFTATGGTPPLTWSVSAGALPPGLTLTSAGVLSGTPTTAGPFNFTVQVTDSSVPPFSVIQSGNTINIQAVPSPITTFTLNATLTMAQEVPAPVPPAGATPAGNGSVTLDLVTKTVTGSFTTTNVTGATAAHIHDGDAGAAGSVVITLVEASPGVWIVPAATVLTDAQISRLLVGGYYVNVRTILNPFGEIRGQLATHFGGLKAFSPNTAMLNGVSISGLPAWYQDQNGVAVQPCLDVVNCGLVGVAEPGVFDPSLPLSFPNNFPSEGFYSIAITNDMSMGTGGGSAFVILALEYAFVDPVTGVFTPPATPGALGVPFQRQRLIQTYPAGSSAPTTGNWTLTTPWGQTIFPAAAAQCVNLAGGIKCTSTIDTPAPGSISANFAALGTGVPGSISTFLTSASPSPPAGFLGSAASASSVTTTAGQPVTITLKDPFENVGSTGAFQTIIGKKFGMTVTPAVKNYGLVAVPNSSPPQTITVTNDSGIPMTLAAAPSGLSIAGPYATDFIIAADNCSGATLPAFGSCTFTVSFSPQQSVPAAAIININAVSPAGTPSGQVILSGNTVVTPQTGSISGTVNYTGSGRVYILVDNTSLRQLGTSVPSGSSTFTIRGVPSGIYPIFAFADTHGTGTPHMSDPIFAGQVDTTLGSISITPVVPAAVAPLTPGWIEVSPANGGALVRWGTPHDANLYRAEVADSYTVYWSTSPNPGPGSTTGGGSKSVTARDDGHLILTGLTDGTKYYFSVTASVGNQESTPSPVFGPVLIGSPASAGVTVSGTIDFSGIAATGPLYLVLESWKKNMYVTAVASPASPQAFSIAGVPDGTYRLHAFLDQNNNQVIDLGDPRSTGDSKTFVTVSGAAVSGVATSINSAGAIASVTTNHYKSSTSESYELGFNVYENAKRPVAATIQSGPNIVGPLDMGNSDGNRFNTRVSLPSGTVPQKGDAYTFTVDYSDGTSETLTAGITAVLNDFASPVSPASGATVTGNLDFSWSAPAVAPAYPYIYTVRMYSYPSTTGNVNWDNVNFIPPSWSSVPYNFDKRADQPSLTNGGYRWNIRVHDYHGNSASFGTPFNLSITAPPTITVSKPVPGATNVALNTDIKVTFSQDMDFKSFAGDITSAAGTVVASRMDYDPFTRTAIFKPVVPLSPGTTYTATLSTAADIVGNAIAGPVVMSFTTGTTAQVATGSDGRTTVPVNMTAPGASLSILPGTLLTDANGNPISGTLSMSTSTMSTQEAIGSASLGQATDGSSLVALGAAIETSLTTGTASVKNINPPMTVNLSIPSTFATPGATVQYFSFDGTKWTLEGTATVRADGTVDMKVGHLSLWAVAKFQKLPSGKIAADGTSNVTVADALKALQIVVGIIQPSANDLAEGDVAPLVNGKPQSVRKGYINVGDAIVILQKSLKIVNW